MARGVQKRGLKRRLCSLLAWLPVVSASRDGSESIGVSAWEGELEDVETGRLVPPANDSLQVLVSSVASMRAARPRAGAQRLASARPSATDVLQGIRQAMQGTPDRAAAARLAQEILSIDWAAAGIKPLDALRLKSAIMGGDSTASLQLVDHISADLRPLVKRQPDLSGVQDRMQPLDEDGSLEQKIKSLRIQSDALQAPEAQKDISTHIVPIGNFEQAPKAQKAISKRTVPIGNLEQVASAAKTAARRHGLAGRSKRHERRQHRKKLRHRHRDGARRHARAGKTTRGLKLGHAAGFAQEHTHVRRAVAARDPEHVPTQGDIKLEKKKLMEDMKLMDAAMRKGDTDSVKKLETATREDEELLEEAEEERSEADKEEEETSTTTSSSQEEEEETSMTTSSSQEEEEETSTTKSSSQEVSTSTSSTQDSRASADEEDFEDKEDLKNKEADEPLPDKKEATPKQYELQEDQLDSVNKPDPEELEGDREAHEDKYDPEEPQDDRQADGEEQDPEDERENEDRVDKDEEDGYVDRESSPGSDGPVGEIQKQCHVDDKGHPESVLKQLQACTRSLNEFAQATQKGHQRSKQDNEALHEEMRKVTQMLAVLLNGQKSQKAFSDDQNGALRYLMSQLEKTNTEIAVLPEGSTRGVNDEAIG